MRKIIIVLIFCQLFYSGVARAGLKKELFFDNKVGRYVEVAAGEILVKYKTTLSAKALNNLNAQNQLSVVLSLPNKLKLLSAAKGLANPKVAELIEAYQNNNLVEYVEPNYVVKAMSTAPNDPLYSNQWGLINISCEAGWDLEKGSALIPIAIIDSGIDLTHQDLTAKIWTNEQEPIDGFDNDGNGLIDDYRGWDWINSDNSPNDETFHGTHVGGVAAASTDNGLGGAGVSWGSKLMVLKVLNGSGEGTTNNVVSAINYAVGKGAKVINLSLGGPGQSASLNEAIQNAHNQGCVVVASVGNDGNTTINYPAGYDNVLGVAAVDRNDNHSNFSNYNAVVDVTAPGGDGPPTNIANIYSTIPPNTYGYAAGTSMAAPFVSGLAALMLAKNPGWASSLVEAAIINNVDDLGSAGRDDYYGYGRINVFNTLSIGVTTTTSTTSTTTSPSTTTVTIITTTIVTTTTINQLIHTYSQGINLISVPFSPPTAEAAASTLGLTNPQISRWDVTSQQAKKYINYPDSFLTSLSPGLGYLINASSDFTVDGRNGFVVDTSQSYEVYVKPNWNMIGNPFLQSINWPDVQVREAGSSQIMTLTTAINSGLVKNGLFSYQNGAYQNVSTLEPWLGYWVRVTKSLYLIIPKP